MPSKIGFTYFFLVRVSYRVWNMWKQLLNSKERKWFLYLSFVFYVQMKMVFLSFLVDRFWSIFRIMNLYLKGFHGKNIWNLIIHGRRSPGLNSKFYNPDSSATILSNKIKLKSGQSTGFYKLRNENCPAIFLCNWSSIIFITSPARIKNPNPL